MSKGDKPYTVEELKSRLESVWSLSSTWRIISLGRGFDNIHFSSQSDRDRVWNRRVWQVKPGIFVFNNGHQISILINKTHLWRGCGFTTSVGSIGTHKYLRQFPGTPLKFDKRPLKVHLAILREFWWRWIYLNLCKRL